MCVSSGHYNYNTCKVSKCNLSYDTWGGSEDDPGILI